LVFTPRTRRSLSRAITNVGSQPFKRLSSNFRAANKTTAAIFSRALSLPTQFLMLT
jgi:hypothetical protein